jgi:hypothetical protein
MKIKITLIILIGIISNNLIHAQIYPDQFYELKIDSIKSKIEISEGIKISDDGKSIVLQNNVLDGYFILKEQTSQFPFNQGLPSYNGKVYDNQSGFKVQMRFPYGNDWSPWLTIGYWHDHIWQTYGTTTYSGGYVDVDYVKLYSYVSKWQFKVILSRNSIASNSPSIYKLSFFVSDSKTTSNTNISQLVNDNPKEIFIPTDFVYQYNVDPVIGKDICSPTTVSMILKSYKIKVDPYQFAVTTYDSYHKMFGVWPRVVQNAAEYGLDGAVTRYRSWSDTRKILESNGRIAMSLGSPLYPNGHLVMLAGFTNDGKVIVHDPARSNGNSYIHDKTSLSQSWFNKGGIAYTFYNPNNVVAIESPFEPSLDNTFELYQNYPNPFNPETVISYKLSVESYVTLKVFDLLGNEIATLVSEEQKPGFFNYQFSIIKYQLSSGVYFYQLKAGNFIQSRKMIIMK